MKLDFDCLKITVCVDEVPFPIGRNLYYKNLYIPHELVEDMGFDKVGEYLAKDVVEVLKCKFGSK